MSRRYGQHQTETQVDCEWATLDVVIHWTLDRDDYLDLVTIDTVSYTHLTLPTKRIV